MKHRLGNILKILKRQMTLHNLSMLPLYAFCIAVLFVAGGRRLSAIVMPPSEEEVQTDCETICNQFEKCMATLVPKDVMTQHRWVVQAGCRNGCSKQRDKLGECFENHPSCETAAACVFGHMREKM